MKMITDSPIRSTIELAKKHAVKDVKAAFPYVSMPIVEKQIIPWLKSRKTKITLVTNLSSFSVAVSLNDPAPPLIRLLDVLRDRLTILSNGHLHGRMLMADNRFALFGSSNLTQGGESVNRELNVLVEAHKSTDKRILTDLTGWWATVTGESVPIDGRALEGIHRQWQNSKALRVTLQKELPEPRLGDDYWKKTKFFVVQPRKGRKAAEKALASQSKEEGLKKLPRNFENKLMFLRDVGVISHWDKDWVYRSDHGIAVCANPVVFFHAVQSHVPGLKEVLKRVCDSRSATYAKLDEYLVPKFDPEDVRVAANWLFHLKLVQRKKEGTHFVYKATKLGHDANGE